MNVTIVGAGPAGLLVANLLADRHHQVTVYEAAPEPGGRARSPPVGDAPMNLGPHAVYRGGPADRLLAQLAVPLPGFVPPPRDTSFDLDGDLLRAPVSPAALLDGRTRPWNDRFEIVRTLLSALARPPGPGPVSAYLDTIRNPTARGVTSALIRVATYTNAPDRLPAATAVAQLRAALRGVRYLAGGWGAMCTALGSRARSRGVLIHTRSPVESIEGTTVTTRTGTNRADAVVVAVSLPVAARLVPSLAAFASGAVASRVATLDLVLAALPVPERRTVFHTTEPLYFSVHSPRGGDPVLAHVMWTLAPGEVGVHRRERLEAWLDSLQPGWRSSVRAARFLPEMTVIDALPLHAPAGVTADGQLFLASDWAVGGTLLDGAATAATAVVTALEERARLAA